ncbi:hypothetical protein [Nodosilinea nodulosa]|uniref:hypothetical protein n=1 Tax=Nodosilinea nodulosa TaxID=416001 RepID=UPI0018C2754B|nr:hypothetical protein [Nodosilinea nodulosa]
MLRDDQRTAFEGNALSQQGAITPYQPAEIVDAVYQALPPARQTRNNYNKLQAAAERPDVLEAVVLEDRDLSRNPGIVNLVSQITINNYYSTPPTPYFSGSSHSPITMPNSGFAPPPVSIVQPELSYRYSPRNTFSPTFSPRIEVNPIIHIDANSISSSRSRSESSSNEEYGGSGRILVCILILLVFFLGAGVAQNQ